MDFTTPIDVFIVNDAPYKQHILTGEKGFAVYFSPPQLGGVTRPAYPAFIKDGWIVIHSNPIIYGKWDAEKKRILPAQYITRLNDEKIKLLEETVDLLETNAVSLKQEIAEQFAIQNIEKTVAINKQKRTINILAWFVFCNFLAMVIYLISRNINLSAP